MRYGSQILVETTKSQKEALTSVLKENGATLTEWFTDHIAEATADFSLEPIHTPPDLRSLNDIENSKTVLERLIKLDWAFSDDDTTYLSHDIHPYPAKFIPQIPRNLISRLSLPGELVWDPFGGCGTTALEAVLLGRQAISSDVNPLAEVIGKGKLITLTKEDDDFLAALVEELFIVTASRASVVDACRRFEPLIRFIPAIPNCSDWFHSQAANELAYLKARISAFESDKCRRLANVCLSKIVLKSSFQDSETRYARCSKEFPPGKVLRLFAGAVESSLKKARYLGTILKFREATFITADLRCDDVVPNDSVDLVVTSPPYPNANDYHLYHRFRLFWLGFDPRQLAKKEIGSHLRHQKEQSGIEEYLVEIHQCLHKIINALRPARYAVIVLGDAVFSGNVFQTASLVAKRAAEAGFEIVGQIDRSLPRHRRSFISPARRLRSESLLILRKPTAEVVARLYPPPYRLWPYEAVIRREEINRLLGVSPVDELGDVLTARINPLHVDKLRRLTFTHSFGAPNVHEEPTWQAILENGEALKSTSRKDPKYATHGIHAYKGKFYPQLARSLFNLARVQSGDRLLDPFCGSGTVPLEGFLNGLDCVGFDMNPLAVKIAKAKTDVLLVDPYLRDRLLAQIQDRIARLEPSPDRRPFSEAVIHEIQSWFPERVIDKLSALLTLIRNAPDVRVKDFLEVLLSNIVRKVSQQDPEDLRIRRRSEPIQDAPVFELFAEHLAEQRRRLTEFASRSNRAPCRFVPTRVFLADSRLADAYRTADIGAQTIDCIITSPPYATALPYIDTDRLSILLLSGLRSTERATIEQSLTGSREIRDNTRRVLEDAINHSEFGDIYSATAREIIGRVYNLNKNADVGFRRKNMAALLYRYFADVSRVIRNLDVHLKHGGSAFFVIGDNLTLAGGKEVRIRSGQALVETVEAVGWRVARRLAITVTKEKRPHSKHAITENEIIWAEKPN
jgi:DNA modification methylase